MENQKPITPPSWSLRLLRLFLRKAYLEEIEGDMEEVFWDNLEQYSPAKARRRYHWDVIKLMRLNLIKGINTQKLNYIGMLQHSFLITLRGFKRHKTTFLINLIGLSTGLAAALLIFLWVNDEQSVDTFHEKNDRLYWAFTHFELTDQVVTWNYTSGRLASAMLEDFPEVEEATRVGNHFFIPKGIISLDKNHFETTGLFAERNFFEMMSYPIIDGDPANIIENKESVAISERMAIRVFGTLDNVVGKAITWENQFFQKELLITGIFKDPPANATQQFEAVINYELLIEADRWANEWKGGYARTYLVLKEGTDIEAFNRKIENYFDDKVENERFTLFVKPYADNYLFGNYESGILVGGRIESVRLFTIIAIVILVIACINFMNLSTAQASRKMKEVGVKKTLGATRRALILQFLFESLLTAFLGLTISLSLVYLLLPGFNTLTEKQIVLDFARYLDELVLIVLATGILAGSYPAFYLSGFNPVAVLKGKMGNLKGEEFVRKGLVIVQFTLSIVFIVGVMVINNQIKFIQTKNLGYNRQNVVNFESKGLEQETFRTFLTKLKQIPGVVKASNMAGEFLWGGDSGSGYWSPESPNSRMHLFKSPKVGYDVIETLGLELMEGRTYQRAFNDTRKRIILNESAVKLLKIKDPVGTLLKYGDDENREIIGVVKDFQYGSMHQKIEPLIFRFRDWGRNCIVKLQEGAEVATLQRIEQLFKDFHPKYNFQATYLDDDYKALYKSEQTESTLSNYMAGIAIIISCLGLFGLAAFTAERRTKEIGIRKILGASRLVIVKLLTSSFAKTLFIAILLSLPIAYYLANSWLQNFAYSIQIRWWFFVIAGGSALVVAWLTVGFQTLKAATINPVDCLRNE